MRLLLAPGHPQAVVVSRPLSAWGRNILDESSISRGPDDLVGGDGHSVELTEARN